MTENLSQITDADLESEIARRRARESQSAGSIARLSKAKSVALLVVAAAAAIYGAYYDGLIGHSGPADHSSEIQTAIGATSCSLSGYGIMSKLTGENEPIYDCAMPSGAEKCVTYSGGIATDSTAVVKLLFANTLSGGRPACVS